MSKQDKEKKKSQFIENVEGYSLGAIIGLSILCILIFGGAYFGVVFQRAILAYLLILTIGPYLFLLAVVCYLLAKFIGWFQEGKTNIAIFCLILLIGTLLFLQFSGTLGKGVQFLKEFGTQSLDERFSSLEKCDGYRCNEKCYTKCETGMKFICDPVQGGTCQYDVQKCEDIGKHTCKGTCWETCPANSQFICDDVQGGICKQY